jgi:hypothetical protein
MNKLISFVLKLAFHPSRVKRLQITLLYCTIGLFANFYTLQLFCTPVWWASLICIAFVTAVAFIPFVAYKPLLALFYFLLGVGVPVCVYIISFFSYPYPGDEVLLNVLLYLIGFVCFGISFLSFIPLYLMYHVYCYFKGAELLYRRYILAGIISPLLVLSFYLFQLSGYCNKLQSLEAEATITKDYMLLLPRNYFTERYLGMHWKYHTRLCYLYDGQRPPLHDPFMVVGLWVYPYLIYHQSRSGKGFTYKYNIDSSKKYYHLLFPSMPMELTCRCSYGTVFRNYP